MNPEILTPKEENLFSLAAEMGLVVMDTQPVPKEPAVDQKSASPKLKPFSQLT
jgi:hypothetical protein